MSALFLALVWLLSTDVSPARTVHPSATVTVYLGVAANQPAAPVEHMKRELSALLQAAGFRAVWADPHNPDKSGEASNLVVLDLHGVCGMPSGNYRMEPSVDSGVSLAETSVSAGGVLPFSWVNCANLTRMIGPVLSAEAGAQRDYLYGRAMARVVAHEVYHVVMGSRDHEREGVAKSRFTVADLLDESFDFDAAALARLRRKASENVASSLIDAADSAIGR